MTSQYFVGDVSCSSSKRQKEHLSSTYFLYVYIPVHEERHGLAGGDGVVVGDDARVGVLVVALDHALFWCSVCFVSFRFGFGFGFVFEHKKKKKKVKKKSGETNFGRNNTNNTNNIKC